MLPGTWCEFGGCPVQGHELGSMIPVGLLQLRIFHDSMMVVVSNFTYSNLGVAFASSRSTAHSYNLLQSASCETDVLENIVKYPASNAMSGPDPCWVWS